ncbi:TcpE family conjugal transfer membrane protein [Nonomuraea sp. 3N208]|uniref:TcpE family conjugal transfer membrane protein n=1 Tax=Nonomuraea sp. 3N208 TaxID=3457421 RepID=UPI003FCD15B1
MDLPTYTNIWRIEKRLYKLYDLRLPMPLPIVWIGVFVGVFIPWSLLLILVGVPVAMPWHVLFLVPPGIVTWLSTRPVIEGKRLTELLESHLRYLGEPKAWYRLTPLAEPETVTFSARVWRTAPARAKSKRPGKSRHPQRRREDQRIAGPRQVRPAVAAAAAAAGQAPVAEPAATRSGWGSRRGAAAPALKAQARQPAPAPARHEEGLSGGPGRRQDLPLVVVHGDDGPGTAAPQARLEREPADRRDSRRTDPGRDSDRTDTGRKDSGRRAGGKGPSGRRLSAREGAVREAATQQAALREAALREAAIREAAIREAAVGDAARRETASEETPGRETPGRESVGRETVGRATGVPETGAHAGTSSETGAHAGMTPETGTHAGTGPETGAHAGTGPEPAGHAAAAPEAGHAATGTAGAVGAATGAEDADDVTTAREPGGREVASRESRSHEGVGRESGAREDAERREDQEVPGEAEDTAGAIVPIKTGGSRKPAAGKPIDTEALRRLRRLAASADAPADTATGRRETAGRAEGERREDEVARDQHRKGQPPRLGPALVVSGTQRVWPPLNPNAKPLPRPGATRPDHPDQQEPGWHDAPSEEVTAADAPSGPAAVGDAPSEGAGTHPQGVPADAPGGPSAPTEAHHRPRLTPVPSDDHATTEESTTADRPRSEPDSAGDPAAAAHGRSPAARGGAGALDGLVEPVPVPRPGETRVRRVESVIGRDSGGWRRIAQVVVGGNNVRTDGSEIDEARARAVFSGSRRIVVLGCTGGAGQSITALMLGHALATYRDDRVVAVDANTGGTTLTSRIQPETPETLTSLLSGLDRVSGYLTMRGYTTRTASGLEVISADTDAGAEQRLADRSFFSDHRLGESMRLLDRHYKLAVIDPAAALAARLLPYADQLVLVVPASEEASEAVGMTYEWLDGHGCAELRRRAVMVVNGVSRRSMADVEQAESVARGRCRAIVRVPWEDDLAPGGAEIVDPGQLRAAGRRAYLALAGVVVAGFATQTVRPSEEELASDPPGTRIGER